MKRQAGVIMILELEVLWLEERFLVRLRIYKGETNGSRSRAQEIKESGWGGWAGLGRLGRAGEVWQGLGGWAG